MSGVRMLHFLKDWWKFIQRHQYYTMLLSTFEEKKTKGYLFQKGENAMNSPRVLYKKSQKLLCLWAHSAQHTIASRVITCITHHWNSMNSFNCSESWVTFRGGSQWAISMIFEKYNFSLFFFLPIMLIFCKHCYLFCNFVPIHKTIL